MRTRKTDYTNYRGGASAFTLIEVVIAVGILSFALVAVAALLPIGLQSNRDSTEETQAVNLLQSLIADRQAASLSGTSYNYGLPALSGSTGPLVTGSSQATGTLFVNESGLVTTSGTPTPSDARYRVTYTIYGTGTLGQQPIPVNFKVSWPAPQTSKPAAVETLATFSQQ